ncbi:hypothetical protein SAMN06893096_1074 [Geodermatophilus pulveris]|uniref:Uncharacterized protein n=1 Tax=Geodermatophilus pulveris TaxID=1564159 RepID=A0A239GQA1_9ACTN|nr:hypothetical protein [Geodermatophilus pulveris]SNS71045.1 hypothetical protein SAMN06893096_1074 [Geodermatophilus pulveris]
MSGGLFGGSGLLPRLRAVPVSVDGLRRVAEDVLPAMAAGRLALSLVDDRADGPVVLLEEDERRVRTPLRDLAEDMTDARVGSTPEELAAALAVWVDGRPVPDAVAAEDGIAVLDWTDRTETSVGWRVVVRRGERALRWSPSAGLDREVVDRVRSAAGDRAAGVGGCLRVEGPVVLWSHPEVPLLATAVLRTPQVLLDRIAAAGLDLRDPHVVVTPASPLACAGAAVAARLAGETGEACQRMPWRQLARLRWA